ncbi:MAG: hypothetical protein ACFB9N_01890 [Geitlerinemataceae cyanobacterium]
MPSPVSSAEVPAAALPDDRDRVWNHLKQAIADSSGFQRWQLDRRQTFDRDRVSLDSQVATYLRETLETLAY